MLTATFQMQPAHVLGAFKELHKQQEPMSLVSRLKRSFQRRLLAWIPPLFVVIPLIAVLNAQSTIHGWQVAYLVVASVLWGASAVALAQESHLRPFVESHLVGNEPTLVRLSDVGVEFQCASTVAATPWSAFTKVLVGREFLFLMRGEVGSFVPLSAFPSEAQMLEFAAYAQSHIPPTA